MKHFDMTCTTIDRLATQGKGRGRHQHFPSGHGAVTPCKQSYICAYRTQLRSLKGAVSLTDPHCTCPHPTLRIPLELACFSA